MSAWWAADPAALVLLACGHVLADFVVQTRGMVAAKRRSSKALALHALLVGAVHGAVVLPFHASPRAWGLVAALALAHGCVDRLKIAYERRRPARPLRAFLGDQALHGLVLYAAACAWEELAPPLGAVRLAALVAVFAFNANGAAALVGALLAPLQDGGEDEGPRGAGRRIGILERWTVLLLVLLGEWAAVGFVLTAKSVARFKRMDEQAFAEVYLVGTMSSVLVAMASGLTLQWILI